MASDRRLKSRKAREDHIQIDALCRGTGWNEEDMSIPHILVARRPLPTAGRPGHGPWTTVS